MKQFLVLLALLACCTSTFAAPADKQFTKSTFTWMNKYSTRILIGKRGEHHFTVRLSVGPLRKDRHVFRNMKGEIIPVDKINLDGRKSGGQISIDGKFDPIGTDYGLPSREFYTIDVSVDGTKWDISEKLWADCFQPHNNVPPWVTLSSDGKRLAIGKKCSDGAGSYAAIWYLHADGHSSRKILDMETYYYSFKKHPTLSSPSTRPKSNKPSS